MADLIFTDINDDTRVGTLTEQDLEFFTASFKLLSDYKGEFGFDWMRLHENGDSEDYKQSSLDFTLLEKEYEVLEFVEHQKYYVPWLCMFPNHETIIGKGVRLVLKADVGVEDIPDYIDFDDKVKLINENFHFAVNGTPGDEMSVRMLCQGQCVNIYNDSPLAEDTSIEVRLFSNILKGEEAEKGKLIGKLNVVKNSDYEKYKMNLYVIHSYINGDIDHSLTEIKKRVSPVDGYEAIEYYLNKMSLNQALIQVKINLDNGIPYEQPITKQELIDNELLISEEPLRVKAGKYTEYVHKNFIYRNKQLKNKKGIFMYLSALQSNMGGGAHTIPLNSNYCVFFRNNLGHISTYSHEIGHVLGLEHPFNEVDNEGLEVSHSQEISGVEKKIKQKEQKRDNYIKTNKKYLDQFPSESKTFIDENFNKDIKEEKDRIAVLNNNKIRFKRGSTDNIMDGDETLEKQHTFWKWQWLLMQDDVKKYYNG